MTLTVVENTGITGLYIQSKSNMTISGNIDLSNKMLNGDQQSDTFNLMGKPSILLGFQ